MARFTQDQQVIEALRREGGYATLRHLYEIVDFSNWKTKTPEATVRRIVQNSDKVFKIQPGLWALEECRNDVLRKFEIKPGDKVSEEKFTHGYYQGLLVEIGNFRNLTTYVPAQDQNRKFLGMRLGDIAHTVVLPTFTYDNLLRKAKTIDVIWFNKRRMPKVFFEVEHTTDIKNSLSKFYELQDFYADFFIVADESRRKEFDDKLHVSMFDAIEDRVKFLAYTQVVEKYEGLEKASSSMW